MRLHSLSLTNFRCFSQKQIQFDAPLVVLEGVNGSGKTSVLEALYYGCYLRSFRTHVQRELIRCNESNLYLQVRFEDQVQQLEHDIHVGVSGAEKVVKFDGRHVHTYKEIIEHFPVIAATEEDVALVAGEPELRRMFLNQALTVDQPDHLSIFKQYRTILHQRNQLLSISGRVLSASSEEWFAWSRQLWHVAQTIQDARIMYLARLQSVINELLGVLVIRGEPALEVELAYQARNMRAGETFEEFWQRYQEGALLSQEQRLGRTLYGPHLDDITIQFAQQRARIYASRGQQKLVSFLMKIAQARLLEVAGRVPVILLDDFLTDFDQNRLNFCLEVLGQLKGQVVLSCPLSAVLKPQIKPFIDVQTLGL